MKGLWLALASHLWQSTIVLVLVALAARALRRTPARVQEALWTAGLVKLVLPGSLLALLFGPWLTGWGPDPGASSVGDAYALMVRVASPDLGTTARAGSEVTGQVGWTLLTVAWVVVAAGVLLLWLRRGVRTAGDGRPMELLPEPLRRKITRAVAGTGFETDRVRLRRGAVMPGLRGLRRPALQLSEDLVRELSAAELRAVVLHEEAHRRRRDVLRRWLERAVASVLFFYPPVWWLLRRLDRTAEMACDEAVLRAGVDPRTYARALARTMRLRLDLADARALGGDGSNLIERLRRIAEPGRYSMKTWHRMIVTTTFVLAAGLILVPLAGYGSGGGIMVESTQRRPPEQRPHLGFEDLRGADARVTLAYREASLHRVVADLSARAGFAVRHEEPRHDSTVTLTVRNSTVAEVLMLLSRQSGAWLQVSDAETLVVRAPIRPGPLVAPPERIGYVAPGYTEEARRARLEGTVILQVVIDENGTVKSAEVLRPLGMGLDEEAVRAVEQWRYRPTVHRGQPVEVMLTVTVQFELDDERVVRLRRTPEGRDPEKAGDPEEASPSKWRQLRPLPDERDIGEAGPRGPLRVGGEIREPERIESVNPPYPELARRARLEGTVILQAIIDKQGNVKDAEVLRPLGLGLDEAAVEAVRQWKYTPTYYEGRPVEVILTVTVQFELAQ